MLPILPKGAVDELRERSKDDRAIIVGSEVRQLCDAIDQLREERDEAVRSKEFTQNWYATRHKRLRELADKHDITTEYCDIVANGYSMDMNPPTYEIRLNVTTHERDDARKEVEKLETQVLHLKSALSRNKAGHDGTRDAARMNLDERDAARAELKALKKARLNDLECAWGVIANAFGGNWADCSPEWKTAAERWRDEVWHPALEQMKDELEP